MFPRTIQRLLLSKVLLNYRTDLTGSELPKSLSNFVCSSKGGSFVVAHPGVRQLVAEELVAFGQLQVEDLTVSRDFQKQIT